MRVRVGKGNDMGGRRRLDLDTSIEHPGVTATVFVVDEWLCAALPGNRYGVGGHARWSCCLMINVTGAEPPAVACQGVDCDVREAAAAMWQVGNERAAALSSRHPGKAARAVCSELHSTRRAQNN